MLDSVSNHQSYDCLLNRLFRRRSKKTLKLRVTGLFVGNSPGPVNSPHKGPVTRKMFPFDDVIMPTETHKAGPSWDGHIRSSFHIAVTVVLKSINVHGLKSVSLLTSIFKNPWTALNLVDDKELLRKRHKKSSKIFRLLQSPNRLDFVDDMCVLFYSKTGPGQFTWWKGPGRVATWRHVTWQMAVAMTRGICQKVARRHSIFCWAANGCSVISN